MPKLFPPSLLENADARTFCLQKQITNTAFLKRHLRESICLSIDVEGCEGIGEGITSIGLAVLPPTDFLSNVFPPSPFETQQIVEQYQIEAYCLYLEGRSRRKPYSAFPFGSVIKTANPKQAMEAIIQDLRHRYPNKAIILIGWHPHPRELPAIQALIPNLFQEVIGWVDVVDITRQICISNQEDLTKSWPPLSDLMISVGFSEICLSSRFCHCAGNDAMHTLAVLGRLLTRDPDMSPLELWRRRPLKHWQQSSW